MDSVSNVNLYVLGREIETDVITIIVMSDRVDSASLRSIKSED